MMDFTCWSGLCHILLNLILNIFCLYSFQKLTELRGLYVTALLKLCITGLSKFWILKNHIYLESCMNGFGSKNMWASLFNVFPYPEDASPHQIAGADPDHPDSPNPLPWGENLRAPVGTPHPRPLPSSPISACHQCMFCLHGFAYLGYFMWIETCDKWSFVIFAFHLA